MTSSRLQLSAWRELPGGWGDALATAGTCSVAASPGGVTIWDGERRLRTVVPAGTFAIGLPRLNAGRILYGTGYERTDGGFHALTLPNMPGGPRSAAWSADGTRVAVLLVHGADGQVVELGADGAVLREVWTGTPPPAALWSGANCIVGIGLRLQAWSGNGEYQTEGHAGGIAAISATGDESRLLTVGWEGTAKLWQTRTWSMIAELHGDWAGGALAPDGQYIVLLTRNHTLQAACMDGAGLRVIGEVQLAEPLVAIALGDGRILGSFRDPPRVQVAEILLRA